MKSILLILLLSLCIFSCSAPETASEEPVPGVTDTEIVIGSWGPLTGPAALWGNVMKGMDAYLKMVNDEGGVNGRKFRFIMKDDAYDPSQTVPAVRELVQREEVFAVAGGIGTAPSMAVMPFLIENNVPWFNPMSGATHFTHPPKENIYSVFPLYYDEARILTKMALDQLGTTKIGIIYMNDDYGKSGLVGVKSILQERNLELVAELPVEVTDTDLSSHLARLKESGAESVLMWTLPRQAAIILGSAAVIDYSPNWLASLTLSDIALMHNITKGAWEGVYYPFLTPTMFNDESDETIAKYKAAYEKYYPEDRWSSFAFTGMAMIEPMVEAIRKSGEQLTRESFLEILSTMEYETPLKIPVKFSSDQHLGVRSVVVMRCISGTEAEPVTGLLTGNADIEALNAMLAGE